MPRHISLDDIYQQQLADHRSDDGVMAGGIPVAATLSDESGWGYERFMVAATDVLRAKTIEYRQGGRIAALVLKYEHRKPEIWVRSREENYAELYRKFCMDVLKFTPTPPRSNVEFDVDHAYCKSAVADDVEAFIRMFLVPGKVNSSWGGYFERRLKDSLARRNRGKIHWETIAIRAKISGLLAPTLGKKGRRKNEDSVAKIVDDLIAMGMLNEFNRTGNTELLRAFCDIADGLARGVHARLVQSTNGGPTMTAKNLHRYGKTTKNPRGE